MAADKTRKKEMVTQWKERHPDIGVAAVTCTATGRQFYAVSRDNATWFNRHRFQLEGGMHMNKELQALWNEYGPEAFQLSAVSLLEYDHLADVETKELNELLELCLLENPRAGKL